MHSVVYFCGAVLVSLVTTTHSYSFLDIPVVKLLSVRSLASRFPAADSEFRTSLENGYDEDIELTQSEILNEFPNKKLTLLAGGCATYAIPILPGQVQAYVRPAKRKGNIYWDFCNKASLSVEVSLHNSLSFKCFEPSPDVDPCSSSNCQADIHEILDPNIGAEEMISVNICADPESANNGAIWEISFSASNDSNKLEVYFVDEARTRIGDIPDIPEFNTQLSFVSIVGGRGVGKSTVTSLLSGNSTLFEIGSASIGTTTTGADLSGVIPSSDWASNLQVKLGVPITPEIPTSYPMLLIDSEGMGVRGDAFDFMTTSPPAIVAKVVIWIGSENVATANILQDLKGYLDGLDNIVMNATTKTFCSSPLYGHFVVVINKMMGASPDDQLFLELMSPEPDYIEGSQDRNQIRQKMRECFNGISVHGLPLLQIPEGESVDYIYLNDRFKTGLAAIASSILLTLATPRVVTVAGSGKELRADNAVAIIATIIEEANAGKIDLNGFNSFWTYVQENLKAEIGTANGMLEIVTPACSAKNLKCSSCVCSYINIIIEKTTEMMDIELSSAKSQAFFLFNIDLEPYISRFRNDVLNPWIYSNSCQTKDVITMQEVGDIKSGGEDVCDLTAINLNTPGQPLTLSCPVVLTCGEISLDATSISITAQRMFVGPGAKLKNVLPHKGDNGVDGNHPGASGTNGQAGRDGFDMTLDVKSLLPYSSTELNYAFVGSNGGGGGRGAEGLLDYNAIPQTLISAEQVVADPGAVQIDFQKLCYEACGFPIFCSACDEYSFYELKQETSGGCGGQGGRGGDGGAAGKSGSLTIIGGTQLAAKGVQECLCGGRAGVGGRTPQGLHVDRFYKGTKILHEVQECKRVRGKCWVGGEHYYDVYEGFYRNIMDSPCPANPVDGESGQPGQFSPNTEECQRLCLNNLHK